MCTLCNYHLSFSNILYRYILLFFTYSASILWKYSYNTWYVIQKYQFLFKFGWISILWGSPSLYLTSSCHHGFCRLRAAFPSIKTYSTQHKHQFLIQILMSYIIGIANDCHANPLPLNKLEWVAYKQQVINLSQ